jgi:hypothetical protein
VEEVSRSLGRGVNEIRRRGIHFSAVRLVLLPFVD